MNGTLPAARKPTWEIFNFKRGDSERNENVNTFKWLSNKWQQAGDLCQMGDGNKSVTENFRQNKRAAFAAALWVLITIIYSGRVTTLF